MGMLDEMFAKSNKIKSALKGHIESGDIASAVAFVSSEPDYQNSELLVAAALNIESCPQEVIDAALEHFVTTRTNRHGQHGFWVHSLSHFTKLLWKRRLIDWIARFNQLAFEGAIKLFDANCCDRLVHDFGEYADWSDDPVKFYLIPQNLVWMEWEHWAYVKARIEIGCFENEEAFIRWEFRQPSAITKRDYNTGVDMAEVLYIRDLIARLHQLGVDTTEFDGVERKLLVEQLAKLEDKLPAAEEVRRPIIQKAIDQTRAALA